MSPELFPIPGPWSGRLVISSRPRGGDWLEDEITSWKNAGIDVVVSLLERTEESQLGLEMESELARQNGLRFISFPIADRGVPESIQRTAALLREISGALNRGDDVAIHCRQSVGRSSLVAAGLLVSTGKSTDAAFQTIGVARKLQVPETAGQKLWVEGLAANVTR